MGKMFGMFSFAFWVLRALKCDAVNFPKFESADITVRLIEYLDVPIFIIACAPSMRACDMHAHCDITRFTFDANHVIMMSLVFTYHLCHIEMRWHDVIGVRIVGTPHHHGLHCMGMT